MSAHEPTRRRAPRGVLLVALLAGFSVSLGIALAVGSVVTGDDDDHPGGPATKRVMVASGTTEGEIGRWRLWRSVDETGRECLEVQTLDDNPDAQVPEKYRSPGGLPVPGGGTLGGGCGSTADFNVASLTGAEETLLYGRAPESAEEVTIIIPGREQIRARARKSEASVPFKFFGVAVPDAPLKDVKAEAKAADGREVRPPRAVPTPGGP